MGEIEAEGTEAPKSADTLSPTGRTRLESSASSRFFPGAWFSPKIGAGRASLEVAQGEFIPVKPTSPTDGVPDEPEELDEVPPTASEDTDESTPEEKRRWCVVM